MADLRTQGRALAAAPDADQFLILEREFGLADSFSGIDAALARIVQRGVAGLPTVDYRPGDRGGFGSANLADRSPEDTALIREHYQLGVQQGRGAWFLPEEATLAVGLANTASFAAEINRFFWNAVRDTNVKVDFCEPSDALLIWSAAIPLFECLYRPFALRADTGKIKDAAAQVSAWAAAEEQYSALGLRIDGAFAAMRFGGRWSRLSLDEQLQCRRQLLDELATPSALEVAVNWRVNSTRKLVDAFYKKAKQGTPLASKVLARALQREFTAVFAGDWLTFLRYLGETPNASEQITTALPETRLYVPDSGQTTEVAATSGVPLDDVEEILTSYLGQDRVVSPVHERVATIRSWWPIFDEVHARQRSGMTTLWGFVDDGLVDPVAGGVIDARAEPGLFRRLLPANLASEIEHLWDGTTLPKFPERIVSEFHPHHQMAETLGPAVDLWHGVALTCWFICEGPSSRTSLDGMEHYYRRPLEQLDKAGFPVDRSLFAELIAAEAKLGPPQDTGGHEARFDAPNGVTISMTAGGYQRRDGFEHLRDIVTRHRRAWAERLNAYLHHRWDSELRTVGREHNRHIAAKGKAPTLRQFASFGATAANHWFGGDLRALYVALGEPTTAAPQRIDLLVGDPLTFVESLYERFGGRHHDPGRLIEDVELRMQEWTYSRLARDALKYLQLWEATGSAPTFDEFNKTSFDWKYLGGETAGWHTYVAAIEDLRVRRSPEEGTGESRANKAPDESSHSAEEALPEAHWAADPIGRYQYRYWNGVVWTEHVATDGHQTRDPLT